MRCLTHDTALHRRHHWAAATDYSQSASSHEVRGDWPSRHSWPSQRLQWDDPGWPGPGRRLGCGGRRRAAAAGSGGSHSYRHPCGKTTWKKENALKKTTPLYTPLISSMEIDRLDMKAVFTSSTGLKISSILVLNLFFFFFLTFLCCAPATEAQPKPQYLSVRPTY